VSQRLSVKDKPAPRIKRTTFLPSGAFFLHQYRKKMKGCMYLVVISSLYGLATASVLPLKLRFPPGVHPELRGVQQCGKSLFMQIIS
jgi:hypothetical protein